MRSLILQLTLFILFCLPLTAQELYYWYDGKKIVLSKDPDNIVVAYASATLSKTQAAQLLKTNDSALVQLRNNLLTVRLSKSGARIDSSEIGRSISYYGFSANLFSANVYAISIRSPTEMYSQEDKRRE